MDWLSKKISALAISSIVALSILGGLALGGNVSADQSSQFMQKIKPTYCSTPDCNLQPPTIKYVHSYSRHLSVFGKYDAHNSQSLRVSFRGVWYTLGVDSQLTVNGNTWKLTLGSGDGLPLKPGDYSIEVRMVTLLGHTMTYTSHLNVAEPPAPDGNSNPDKEPSITLLPPSTGFSYIDKSYEFSARQSFFDSLVVASVVCALGLGLLTLAWRLNKR